MTKRKPREPIDWDKGERLYRTGQISQAELSRELGCTRGAVSSRIKKYKWQRDLSLQVRNQTNAKLTGNGDAKSDAKAIEDAANKAAAVVRGHRGDLHKARQAVSALVGELAASIEHNESLHAAVIAALESEGVSTREAATWLNALSLPSRASAANQIANALTRIVAAERQSYNLDEQRDAAPFEEQLREIAGESGEGTA